MSEKCSRCRAPIGLGGCEDEHCPVSAPQASQSPQGAWHGARFKRIAHEGGGESYEMIHPGQWRPEPQPPQGAEPAQFAEQDERGVWRTEDGFPSPENAWEAMLVARARSGHALSYSDTSRIILDLRRAALAAPPQGASSLLPGWRLVPVEPTSDMLNAALAANMPFGGYTTIDSCSQAHQFKAAYSAMLAASPLPAPQEPAEPLGEVVGTHKVGFAELATVAWAKAMPPVGTKLYAAPAPDSTP